jgi:hypothetical protein
MSTFPTWYRPTPSSVVAEFTDGSELTLSSCGGEPGGRQQYRYCLTVAEFPHVVAYGNDLRSGVGEPVNVVKALSSWVSFALADAEEYQAFMRGSPMQEWAYQHDDELSTLACDLEDELSNTHGARRSVTRPAPTPSPDRPAPTLHNPTDGKDTQPMSTTNTNTSTPMGRYVYLIGFISANGQFGRVSVDRWNPITTIDDVAGLENDLSNHFGGTRTTVLSFSLLTGPDGTR